MGEPASGNRLWQAIPATSGEFFPFAQVWRCWAAVRHRTCPARARGGVRLLQFTGKKNNAEGCRKNSSTRLGKAFHQEFSVAQAASQWLKLVHRFGGGRAGLAAGAARCASAGRQAGRQAGRPYSFQQKGRIKVVQMPCEDRAGSCSRRRQEACVFRVCAFRQIMNVTVRSGFVSLLFASQSARSTRCACPRLSNAEPRGNNNTASVR